MLPRSASLVAPVSTLACGNRVEQATSTTSGSHGGAGGPATTSSSGCGGAVMREDWLRRLMDAFDRIVRERAFFSHFFEVE